MIMCVYILLDVDPIAFIWQILILNLDIFSVQNIGKKCVNLWALTPGPTWDKQCWCSHFLYRTLLYIHLDPHSRLCLEKTLNIDNTLLELKNCLSKFWIGFNKLSNQLS